MYNVNELDNKIRRRLITIIVATVVLILVLIVAIVVVATTKSTHKNIGGENNTEFTMVSDDKTEELPAENEPQNDGEESSDKKEEAPDDVKTIEIGKISNDVVSSNTISSQDSTVDSAPQNDSSDKSLPNTGPEDLLPLALVAGLLVTYLLSRLFAKEDK